MDMWCMRQNVWSTVTFKSTYSNSYRFVIRRWLITRTDPDSEDSQERASHKNVVKTVWEDLFLIFNVYCAALNKIKIMNRRNRTIKGKRIEKTWDHSQLSVLRTLISCFWVDQTTFNLQFLTSSYQKQTNVWYSSNRVHTEILPWLNRPHRFTSLNVVFTMFRIVFLFPYNVKRRLT